MSILPNHPSCAKVALIFSLLSTFKVCIFIFDLWPSRSRMGRAILSQPACVSKLLSLLLDHRPSPKLVLIILQLCRVALPLMSGPDCAHVQLPAWGAELASTGEGGVPTSDPPARIASLLLAKLGDCVVPGRFILKLKEAYVTILNACILLCCSMSFKKRKIILRWSGYLSQCLLFLSGPKICFSLQKSVTLLVNDQEKKVYQGLNYNLLWCV